MGPQLHLVQRGRVFHFRRVVPAHARAAIGCRELGRTLQTSDPRIARLRAAPLYVITERIIETASQAMLLDEKLLARLVQDFYSSVLENENQSRIRGVYHSEEIVAARASFWASVATQSKQSLAGNRLEDAAWMASGVLKKNEIAPSSIGPDGLAQVRQAMLRAGVDLAEALRARFEGDFNYEPRDRLLKLKIDETLGGDVPIPEVEPEPEPAPAVAPGLLMSIVGSEFRERQVAVGAWDGQTAHQAGATFRLFIEVCGDRATGAYTRRDSGQFRSMIERLPSDYGKAALFRDLLVSDIVQRYEALPLDVRSSLITQKTVQRHFSALSTLWTDLVAKGEVLENIFQGFKFTNTKRANEQRDMWKRADLQRLFETPVWTGSKSEWNRSTPGDFIIRDERFWIPLISVFSGLRQEEICQLHLTDIQASNGIHYFDINDKPPRHLKNDAAIRQVPIHPELGRLGLLKYVEQVKRQGHDRIFPALEPGGADRRFGHAFSKWFTRYRQDTGLYQKRLDFHSFRHTATTLMHQAEVERAVLDHVTGHETPGETTRYTKGSTLTQLSSAIAKIDIEVDLSRLYVDQA